MGQLTLTQKLSYATGGFALNSGETWSFPSGF